MCENPEQRPFLRGNFAESGHTRSPPLHRAVVRFQAHDKNIAVFFRDGRRLDNLQRNGIFYFWLRDESDFAFLFAKNFLHVALVDFGLDIKRVNARHFEKCIALLDRRRDSFA